MYAETICNLMCPVRMEPMLSYNVIMDWLAWMIGGVGDDVVWAGITPCLCPLMSRQPFLWG